MRRSTKFFMLRASIIVMFSILAGRLWYVQVVMGGYYKQQGDTSKLRNEPVPALRGIIYDRNGVQLVYNTPSWNIEIVPHGVPSRPESMYRQLSSLLSGHPTARQIARIVESNTWHPYAPALVKPNVPVDAAMIIKQLHAQLPGVRADATSVRHYRQGDQFALSHIIGYAGSIGPDQFHSYQREFPAERISQNDLAGQAGVELSMDSYLHGVNDNQKVMVDAGERVIRVMSRARTVPGDSVYLTINWNLQKAVASDLSLALSHLNPPLRRGVAVVEDVNTGAILAMVSLPSFDNNWFATPITQKRYSSLLQDPAQPLNDMATAGLFPPGSTYKIVTAAAALQSHVIDSNTTIDDTGYIKLCSTYDVHICQTFFGWNANGLGQMNVVSALAESSDIFFYTVGGGNPNLHPSLAYLGGDRLAQYARLFGLGSPTGIEIPGEARGLVPSPSASRRAGIPWYRGNTYNVSIGQGDDEVTPLQMANAVATIANGGTLFRPHIIDRIVGQVVPKRGVLPASRTILPHVPFIVRRNFIDPGNLALIQQGMHGSVTLPYPTGTSFNVQDSRIDAAGKTGTAEATGGPHSWWVGYAPYEHPQIAVAVVVPNAYSEGAYVAAPIAHKIFEDYFHLKPIAKNFSHLPLTTPNWLVDIERYLVPGGKAG